MTTIEAFIAQMPKVELHVHLEGATAVTLLPKVERREIREQFKEKFDALHRLP